MKIAWFYDMDACRGPTGVTRHALAQLDQLAEAPGVELRMLSGRIREPDALAYWERYDHVDRRELPMRTRDLLRLWRTVGRPSVDHWAGPVDWIYCPSEYFVVTSKARLAVTSHDVLQDLEYRPARRRAWLHRLFARAERILSVSRFNTRLLLQHFPQADGKVALVPNAADDLFFEEPTPAERAAVRNDLGLGPGRRYLLSVANFQRRKNLVRMIDALGRLKEVASGELALILLGEGAPEETSALEEAVARLGSDARVRFPGYRQGRPLRAAYAEAEALIFPSLCESFGIPAVEAMAQGTPVALADSTALPEVAGESGWYFPPEDEEALTHTVRQLLDDPSERRRRIDLGRTRALQFRWSASARHLLDALDVLGAVDAPV